MIRSLTCTLAALAASLGAVTAQDGLGLGKMWTFEDPPLGYLEREHGFRPTREWLDALRLASIRFGDGCSSSFVSPRGLIMTNQHCVRAHLASVQAERDWVRDGFYAATTEQEVALPGLTVQQLTAMRDVTADIAAGIPDDADDATVASRRHENRRRVIREAKAEAPEQHHQIVGLFQGAVVHLYSYEVYDDVRLVFSPHLQAANFGGDKDNFTYPRHCLDVAFCRAYVDGKPADTSSHYLKVSTRGAREGELVFVTGNPGTTKRMKTLAQLEYYRDAYHPIVNELVDSRLLIRKLLVATHPELERELRTEILSWANTKKAFTGYYMALLDPSLMDQKEAAEAAFRARVDGDPALRATYGGVWDRLADAARRRIELEPKLRFHSTGGHPVLAVAMMIVRALAPETTDDARARLKKRAVRIASRIDAIDDLTRMQFVDHLERARNRLPADDPYLVAVLGDRQPGHIADLLAESRLRDARFVEKLFDDPRSDLGRDEPALRIAAAFVPLAIRNQAVHDELSRIEEVEEALLGQAVLAVQGNGSSPDATFTLRFSDGIVSGYRTNRAIPHRTTFYGLFGRHADFGGKPPFDLPRIWLERRHRIALDTPLNVVSTNDIIGGNSGSPLVNKDLEVVGLVFDGNLQMLPNRYLYRGDVARTISVHAAGIVEALREVYDAERLVAELLRRE